MGRSTDREPFPIPVAVQRTLCKTLSSVTPIVEEIKEVLYEFECPFALGNVTVPLV